MCYILSCVQPTTDGGTGLHFCSLAMQEGKCHVHAIKELENSLMQWGCSIFFDTMMTCCIKPSSLTGQPEQGV